MPQNFKAYTIEEIRKVNAQRRAISQPTITDPPILTKGQVLFTPASELNNQPASCYTCRHFNSNVDSCELIGSSIVIRKFIYPKEPTPDAKQIEYWPCCSAHLYGEVNTGRPRFSCLSDPDNLGLIWINAPRVGQRFGGANCGGRDGGDDCDSYCTIGDDKRAEPTAFCRVLQQPVENGAVCTAWQDDDEVSWKRAQALIDELDGKSRNEALDAVPT